MRRLWILAPAVIALAACGGGSGAKKATSSPNPPRQTVEVAEREFSIQPNAIRLSQQGTYVFRVTNNGKITHAFAIEGNGVDEKSADVQPGKTVSITVRLAKKGTYQAYCPIDGHRSKGMLATITVGKAALSGPGTTTGTATT